MPIHDWTRVDAGLFHAFHLGWTVALSDALNSGNLPPDYYALIAPGSRDPIPDGLAVPARFLRRPEAEICAHKANHVSVRHRGGRIVSVLEIISPGNKGSRKELREFVEKSIDLLHQGIHLLLIDLFPASKRDPQSIHSAIWQEFQDEPFEMLSDKPLTLVAYTAGPTKAAYFEPTGVGDVLSDMPLFLTTESYVSAPLEQTYQRAWASFPNALKPLLTAPPP